MLKRMTQPISASGRVATLVLFTCIHVTSVFTHAGCIAAGVGIVFSCVCLFVCLSVCALRGKRLELSTQNFVFIYSVAVARHALPQRSKGQRSRSHSYENRHDCTFASDACCYGCVLLLPAWVCMSIRLPMFSSCVFVSRQWRKV